MVVVRNKLMRYVLGISIQIYGKASTELGMLSYRKTPHQFKPGIK